MKRLPVLDDSRVQRRYDRGHVAETIAKFPAQVKQAARDAKFQFSARAKNAHTLVVVGMGGSALGADVVKGVLADSLKKSLVVVRSPELPAFVRPGCVVLSISYSGTTAETLAATAAAKRRGVPIGVITTGGKLARLAVDQRLPHLLIKESVNPSRQPRLATASLTAGMVMALRGLGWTRFGTAEQSAVTRALTATWRQVEPTVPTTKNPLKKLARQLEGKFILAVASDRYWGNAHVAANQFNENAKTLAAPFALPELNHHLLEGLRFPKTNRSGVGLFLTGSGDESLADRFKLTKTVFRRQHLATADLTALGTTPLAQAFSFIVQTSTLSLYVALLNRVDPSTIPWVNFFKRELGTR